MTFQVSCNGELAPVFIRCIAAAAIATCRLPGMVTLLTLLDDLNTQKNAWPWG